MRTASRLPGSPVAALAFPEFNTTAAARPFPRCRREICTGAACARFVVNTPAAATATRSSVATIARSGAPVGLIPHASPPATNPGAAVTLTLARSRLDSHQRQARGLRHAHHEVRGLDHLSRRALDEVVLGGDRDHGVG